MVSGLEVRMTARVLIEIQSAVMNYTEMEAKVRYHCHMHLGRWLSPCVQVREATNNEPWGASSTQLQEIANGTHS